MGKLYFEKWGRKYIEITKTENVPISLIQYREDCCEIYELPNNKIIKLSSNDEGYTTAMQLCGKKNKNIVDIYQYGCFECTNHTNDEQELIYYIIMEKLNIDYIPPAIVRNFVDAFRHCWFIQYKNEYKPNCRYLTYKDLKFIILKDPSSPEIEIVRKYIVSYVNSENKETILFLFKETCNAYHELYNARIDFNESNIGFYWCPIKV